MKRTFQIGISNNVENGGNERVMCLHFMDTIKNNTSTNWITGEVSEESLLGNVIDQVNAAAPLKVVQYIDSWGGSAPVGLGIYNYLKGNADKFETETVILNNCASIATVMAFAGKKITMPRNGIMVIHQASIDNASGTSADLREAAAIADVYTENILDVYVQNNRKGKTRDELFALIENGDYWMTGAQAEEMGFIDATYNDEKVTITNSLKSAKEIYNNIPKKFEDFVKAQAAKDGEAEFEEGLATRIWNKIKNTFKMDINEIVNDFKAGLPQGGLDVTNGGKIDIFAALEAPVTAMLEKVKAEISNVVASEKEGITNQITEVTNSIAEQVKNAVEAAVGELKTSLETVTNDLKTANETITAQAKTIEDLSADMEAKTKQSGAAGNENAGGGNAQNAKPSFAGRVKYADSDQ